MSWWQVLWGAITLLTTTLADFIEAVYCMLKVWFCWVMTATLELALTWLEPLLHVIGPPPPAIDFSFLAGTWATLNFYTPASEALVLLTAYGLIYVTILTYRLIKTHIPTLS